MKQKVVYQCDVSGVYIGPATAYESPLEPDVFILPSGCVEKSPPSKAGYQAVWSGTKWTLVANSKQEEGVVNGDSG